MKNASEYRKFAEDCRKLAQETPAHSEALLKIAEAWTALADQAEAKEQKPVAPT
jgi:hypothetical protein